MKQQVGQNKFLENALKYGFSLFGLPPAGQTIINTTGDDGYYKKGYPRHGSRFVNNADGTTTDYATGLMWVNDPSILGGSWGTPGSPAVWGWQEGIAACEALNYAGHTDWRMPNLKELLSIVDYGKENPCIDTVYFPNIKVANYWSSTHQANPVGSLAFRVEFNIGTLDKASYAVSQLYVRPVRGGYPP